MMIMDLTLALSVLVWDRDNEMKYAAVRCERDESLCKPTRAGRFSGISDFMATTTRKTIWTPHSSPGGLGCVHYELSLLESLARFLSEREASAPVLLVRAVAKFQRRTMTMIGFLRLWGWDGEFEGDKRGGKKVKYTDEPTCIRKALSSLSLSVEHHQLSVGMRFQLWLWANVQPLDFKQITTGASISITRLPIFVGSLEDFLLNLVETSFAWTSKCPWQSRDCEGLNRARDIFIAACKN